MSTTFDDLFRSASRPSALIRAAALVHIVVTWPFRVHEARQVMRLLGSMDVRELSDIGLSSQDLRDAASVSIGQDPTLLLQRRARERRRRSDRRLRL